MSNQSNMKMKLLATFLIIFSIHFLLIDGTENTESNAPLVVITWDYHDATQIAWDILNNQKQSSIDAIEGACLKCEEQQCRTTVGYGGSPDETGETTLDAMIMDGVTMDIGAVGGLRNIKQSISVARKVLENTKHTLLAGSLATKFAMHMGFKSESLTTNFSLNMWQTWEQQKCQPNFWKNVSPDPSKFCGPYTPNKGPLTPQKDEVSHTNAENHDTIAVIAIDSKGKIAAGTSTNGAKFKIPGRVGDSPVPGAGCYADQEVGAAAGTGDGDILMRFLPSFLAVEEMRRGASPAQAAEVAIRRIGKHHTKFVAGVIALNKNGEYGAACHGIDSFPFYVSNSALGAPTLLHVSCINSQPVVAVI